MQTIRDAFDQAMGTALSVSRGAHEQDASGNYVLPLGERELITQAAFVRMFVAFEEFLESSFAHYGMGGRSISGNSIQCYASAPSADHLHRMFIGSNRFVDWSTPDRVKLLADLYFPNGEPFNGALNAADTDLRDMKTVRNAASHVSRTTSLQAEALYRRWTGQPKARVTAYEILTSTGGNNQATFMAHAEAVLRSVVSDISLH